MFMNQLYLQNCFYHHFTSSADSRLVKIVSPAILLGLNTGSRFISNTGF